MVAMNMNALYALYVPYFNQLTSYLQQEAEARRLRVHRVFRPDEHSHTLEVGNWRRTAYQTNDVQMQSVTWTETLNDNFIQIHLMVHRALSLELPALHREDGSHFDLEMIGLGESDHVVVELIVHRDDVTDDFDI